MMHATQRSHFWKVYRTAEFILIDAVNLQFTCLFPVSWTVYKGQRNICGLVLEDRGI